MNRLVAWFVHNPIAANLLMVLIFVGGFMAMPSLDKQFFPEREINQIQVTVVYPGAGPAEVERQVVMRIEEAVDDLDGIDEMRSVASEGLAQVTLDAEADYDSQRLLNDVKSRIDAINTFPVEAERPQVTEIQWKSRMMTLTLAGDIGEANLKALGYQLRDELSALEHVSTVELRQPRKDELSIEVSEDNLRRYGLRFEDVANAVAASSLNLPAGKIRTEQGDIQLQTRNQGYRAEDFADVVVVKKRDGTELTVADVATVRDGFEELDLIARFDESMSLSLDIYVTNHPDVLLTSQEVRDYVERVQSRLPTGVRLEVWRDASVPFKQRISTLVSNGLGGLALVFIVLLLFLRPRLAFWVCTGIAVAFFGALWLLPYLGASLNMISLFAFILILGIIVDDAIIVAESIYSQQQTGMPGDRGAILGTQLVLKPVWFAVISTMLFFIPMFFLPGDGPEPKIIPQVVLLALSFSLIESMFILPAHLAHMPPEKPPRWGWLIAVERVRSWFANGMGRFARNRYRPALVRCLQWRGPTVAAFVAVLAVSLSVVIGGWLKMSFFPRVNVDFISGVVTLPEGGPFSDTRAVLERLESTAQAMRDIHNREGTEIIGHIESVGYGSSVWVTMELKDYDEVGLAPRELVSEWQEKIGPLPNVEDFEVLYTIMNLGKPISLEVSAPDVDSLRAAVDELRAELARYPGVFNVRDSLDNPRSEIELTLKPEAETLNLTLAEVARQVRRAFYGEEVQRIPRLREDVKVMVRYPEAERETVDSLHDMRVRTRDGIEVPFDTVAAVKYVPGYRKIERIDRKRAALVTAELSAGYSAGAVVAAVRANFVPQLQQRYPQLTVDTEGEQQEQAEFISAMYRLMALAAVATFGLMAIAFRSYWQPLLLLTAVPFGVMGAIFGHLLLGRDLSMFSLMGIIACAGVVVNDNLVLIDRINNLRATGLALVDALLQAGEDRFRPIILTSVTTFIGLLPIMTETSVQAQFLIPMVISLAFGVLLATGVTLFFVPCVYLLGSRLKAMLLALRQMVSLRLRQYLA